jgi:hypothetical protein
MYRFWVGIIHQFRFQELKTQLKLEKYNWLQTYGQMCILLRILRGSGSGELVAHAVKALLGITCEVHVDGVHEANSCIGHGVLGHVEHVELVFECGRVAIHGQHANRQRYPAHTRL